jgi:hypothetical protein
MATRSGAGSRSPSSHPKARMIILERPAVWALAALLSVEFIGACGTAANTTGTTGGCGSGEVYCTACGGGGFCSQGCPTIVCPAGDSGTADGAANGDAAADASDVDIGVSGFQGVCPGASPPATGYPLCRSAADCTGGASCAQQPFGGCGACVTPQHVCKADSDCLPAGAAVCEPYVETSGCICGGSPNGTRCMAKCPGRTCETDTQCSATGHCQPTPCGQGYNCPSGRACKPSDPSADAHGCGLKLCTEGFACAADQVCDQANAQADAHGCGPAPCSSGYACPTGWHCVAGPGSDVHGCTPIPCSGGPSCGVNESCDPTQPGRGCVLRTCTRDSDCDCGACVQGNCQPSLWICTSAHA